MRDPSYRVACAVVAAWAGVLVGAGFMLGRRAQAVARARR